MPSAAMVAGILVGIAIALSLLGR